MGTWDDLAVVSVVFSLNSQSGENSLDQELTISAFQTFEFSNTKQLPNGIEFLVIYTRQKTKRKINIPYIHNFPIEQKHHTQFAAGGKARKMNEQRCSALTTLRGKENNLVVWKTFHQNIRLHLISLHLLESTHQLTNPSDHCNRGAFAARTDRCSFESCL